MRKLTLVVTCTDRKSLPAPAHLQARNLPAAPVSERAQEWRRRLRRSHTERALLQLYQGDAWSQVGHLACEADRRGFATTILVASAGLGLRDARGTGPSYAATFAPGHLDSVGATRSEVGEWWDKLKAAPGAMDLRDVQGPVLLVLSEPYARAMKADLKELAGGRVDALLVGGESDIDGIPRLPADLRLRRTLGGTATSVNLRMATRWMTRLRGPSLHTETDRRNWDQWAETVRQVESYDRQKLTDQQVLTFIESVREVDRTISATRALRKLRDGGSACEQKRFGALFRSEAGSA